MKDVHMRLLLLNKTDIPCSARTLRHIVQGAIPCLPISLTELSVAIVGEKEMESVNRQYRKVDAVTDVLSFDYGEILLCPAYIKKKYKITKTRAVQKKMYELFIHGLAHIAGFSHDTPKEAGQMEVVEGKIMTIIKSKKLNRKRQK